MLDLKIFPSRKIKQSVPSIACQVSRPVDCLRVIGIKRICRKCLRRRRCISIISEGKCRACHAKLSNPANVSRFNQMVFLVKQKYPFIRKRNSNRKLLLLGIFAFQNMIGTVTGNLRRSIEIHKRRIRIAALPCVKLPDRHRLSTE